MPTRSSADIIQFPTRTPDPALRLRTALVALDAAVRQQREAAATWRSAIGDLRTTMNSLGTSLHTYRDSVDALGTKVETLTQTARRLQADAESL